MPEITRPALIIFQGGAVDSQDTRETMVLDAQRAAVLDLLALAGTARLFDRVFLVTEDDLLAKEAQAELAQGPGHVALLVCRAEDYSPGEFHFGNALRALCKRHNLERVVYSGGAALPLATAGLLADLATAASGASPCVMANNLYSADHLAFWPTQALDSIDLPASDNNLAWQLHYAAGLPFAALPRSLGSDFDIDTPPDMAALWLYSQQPGLSAPGTLLRGVLDRVPSGLPVLVARMEEAYKMMSTRRSEVLVAGRVSSWVWRRLESNLPCQTRIVSEERGMQASGREARGEVRSLLGMYAGLVGAAGLIQSLSEVCDAAFLDTRVLFAHRGLRVSRADRFASDALLPDQVSEEWVRELTQAASSSQIPIVLGGHSLISGGVWALSERVRNSPAGP